MAEIETLALQIAQDWAVEHFASDHRFTTRDLCDMHRKWLGAVYPWAGELRSVNVAKGGFQFAAAHMLPKLMDELEQGPLSEYTPCVPAAAGVVARAMAVVHAELVLIHPFREGNGRLARIIALLMGYQASLPVLYFSPLAGRGKRAYIAAIHAALDRDYAPMTTLFESVVARASQPDA